MMAKNSWIFLAKSLFWNYCLELNALFPSGIRREPNALVYFSKRPAIAVPQSGQYPVSVIL